MTGWQVVGCFATYCLEVSSPSGREVDTKLEMIFQTLVTGHEEKFVKNQGVLPATCWKTPSLCLRNGDPVSFVYNQTGTAIRVRVSVWHDMNNFTRAHVPSVAMGIIPR